MPRHNLLDAKRLLEFTLLITLLLTYLTYLTYFLHTATAKRLSGSPFTNFYLTTILPPFRSVPRPRSPSSIFNSHFAMRPLLS